MRAIVSDTLHALAPSRAAGFRLRAWVRRATLGLAFALGVGACTAADASAFTLRLVFPDGQPMTYGSACAGLGCLQRGANIETTDARGEIELNARADAPEDIGTLALSRTIEYRRDGIILGIAPSGVASGTVLAVGDRATVVLPRMLVGSAPAVDAVESDLVARPNEARAQQGLALAEINPKPSTAADLQATGLMQTGVTFADASRFHTGPFESDMAFRHGEVSLPDPASGGEVAEAGGTMEETVGDWMASPEHRQQILAPGRLLIGAAKVGIFIIVQTHRPCDGCVSIGTGTRMAAPGAPAPAPAAPPAPVAAPPAAAAPTAGASVVAATPLPTCGRERLVTRRLRSQGGRVRLRVATSCLRPRARYALLVRQGATGKILRSVRITRAGTMTVRLRPARTATRLRITLKRDGQVVIGRTMSLRT